MREFRRVYVNVFMFKECNKVFIATMFKQDILMYEQADMFMLVHAYKVIWNGFQLQKHVKAKNEAIYVTIWLQCRLVLIIKQ